MMPSVPQYECGNCPALSIRTEEQKLLINKWYALRLQQISFIGQPKVVLLCESFPQNKYIYDLNTAYQSRGLRYNLKKELYAAEITDEEFIKKLRTDKILIVDCAFCPLFLLGRDNKVVMRAAATTCLKSHSLEMLNQFSEAVIITIFPKHRGYLKRQIPQLSNRIVGAFDFNSLIGLKALLNSKSIVLS